MRIFIFPYSWSSSMLMAGKALVVIFFLVKLVILPSSIFFCCYTCDSIDLSMLMVFLPCLWQRVIFFAVVVVVLLIFLCSWSSFYVMELLTSCSATAKPRSSYCHFFLLIHSNYDLVDLIVLLVLLMGLPCTTVQLQGR